MPNNRPISDLQNYKDVLREVQADAPVLLIEDGHAKYVILCIQDYEQMRLAFSTYDKLQEAEQEARSIKVRDSHDAVMTDLREQITDRIPPTPIKPTSYDSCNSY